MRRVLALSLLGAAVLAVVLFVVFSEDTNSSNDSSSGGAALAESELDQANAEDGNESDTTEANAEDELANADRTEVEEPKANVVLDTATTPASLNLRLVDSSGQPAAKGSAKLSYSDRQDISGIEFGRIMDRINGGANSVDDSIEVEVDESGQIFIENVKPGFGLSLALSGPYWAEQNLKVAALDPGEARELGEQVMAPGVLLSGRILGPDGNGIEGAKIQLSDLNSKGDFSFSMASMPGEFKDDTKTDKDGRFAINGVKLGSYTLEANAPGFVLASTSLELTDGRKDHSVELHLATGGFVTGVVRDEDGKPLPGAHVALVRSRGFSTYQWDHKRLMKEGMAVEQDGSFKLAGLPSEGKWRIVAAAEGFARGRSENVSPGAKMELLLAPQMKLSGTLHDSRGLAVSDAEIRLVPQTSEPNRDFFSRASTVSDESGGFVFDDLKKGNFKLEVTSAAGVLSMDNVEVGPSSDPLQLVLPATEALVITVMDPDGNPLEGASVKLKSDNNRSGQQVMTSGGGRMRIVSENGDGGELDTRERSAKSDAHGQVRIGGLGAGAWKLSAKLENYASLPVEIQRKGDGQQFEKIVLYPESKIRLTAVDISGTPVAGAKVVLSQDGETGFKSKNGVTDPWGLIVWNNLPPGVYRISESSEDQSGMRFMMPGSEEDKEDEQPTSNDVVCELNAGELAEQQIIMAAKSVPTILVTRMGTPVASADVKLLKGSGGESSFSGLRGFDEGTPSGTTDAQGLAVLPPCDAGVYTIEARATSSSPATKMEVNLQPGQQQLFLELATGVITGTVVGNSGPLSGAQVRLNHVAEGSESRATRSMVFAVSMGGDDDDSEVETMDFSPGQTTATTDDKGQFRFQDVPAGNYEVRVVSKGYITLTQDAKPYDGAGQMDYGLLQMEIGASLVGQVIGLESANNEPGTMSMELLELRDEDDQQVQMSVLRSNGSFSFKDLKPGTYYLVLRSNGEENRSDKIVVGSGTPTQFNFTL